MLSVLLIIIFDTLIRYEPESKLKRFWIKKIPVSIANRIERVFSKFNNTIRDKILENQKIPRDTFQKYNTSNLNIIEEFIRFIPSKYAIKIFIASVLFITLFLIEFVYNIFKHWIPHYIEIFKDIFI